MSRTLLFCTAEEAKPCIPGILKAAESHFWLLESQECPSDDSGLKHSLAPGEPFDASAFIGASVEDCQKWFHAHHGAVNFILGDGIAIADARTAQDGTISMQYYYWGEPWDCHGYGLLPPNGEAWYDFRIRPEDTGSVIADLAYTPGNVNFPFYFGRREEFTDENGVFDVAKVDREFKGVP
ncbi:hypothetical protein DM02DRAFT_678344 [Periconia macrospinosa]|uniref:Uncharacterized protein n=1 Tax=Periconia macrospinosa TaxID=97972 RepID=A0A2V1CYT8_9PLEO|nr:hypothetical protein DM02DRAFT_678344 [Periconia macrospinosa]